MNDPTRPVTSAARIRAYHLLTPASPLAERRLMAVIDGACCLIAHAEHGGLSAARLILETVAPPATALAALRILTGEDRT